MRRQKPFPDDNGVSSKGRKGRRPARRRSFSRLLELIRAYDPAYDAFNATSIKFSFSKSEH